jgi:hypothetical protein
LNGCKNTINLTTSYTRRQSRLARQRAFSPAITLCAGLLSNPTPVRYDVPFQALWYAFGQESLQYAKANKCPKPKTWSKMEASFYEPCGKILYLVRF